MDSTRRRILQTLGLTIAGTPLAPLAPGEPVAEAGQVSCAETASDTVGPYPSHQAFYRQDVREGRPGLPLTLALTVVNTTASCAPIAGASVEIWQCDASGHYSEYAQPGYDGSGQTFLRGLQVADANGRVTFTTIYPGWYQGRATHIHLKVFVGSVEVRTTQLAFPEAISQLVYATVSPYSSHGQNSITNTTDNVFADGTSTQMVTLTGDTTSGYTGTLTLAVGAGGGNTNAGPAVTITTPETTTATATSPFFSIAGTASVTTGAVASVTWSSSRGASGSATGTTSWQADVPLVAGANVITVTAANASGSVGTATVTITASRFVYILAEGATGPFFDLDLLIANPNLVEAPVTIQYLKDDGTTVDQALTIPAQRHATIRVAALAGLEATSVSSVVTSVNALPLAVERTMRWDATGYAAHTEKAAAGARLRWVFAEGSQGYFDTYLLLANPQAEASIATVTFLVEGGDPVVRTYTLAPTSRTTVYTGFIGELVDRSFGITVIFTQPGVAERAMYFGATAARAWSGGHESAGANDPSTHWFLAEGAIGSFFDTFILLANPNTVAVDAALTLLLDTGATIAHAVRIPASSRATVNIETVAGMPAGAAVATTVDATAPIVAERSMYWANSGWYEAHNGFGLTATGTRWVFGEGRVGGTAAYQTYILIANPGSVAATVTVTYLREGAAPIVRSHIVPPTSRMNIVPAEDGLSNESFGALLVSSAPIVTERALYWTNGGAFWAAGTNASATRLP